MVVWKIFNLKNMGKRYEKSFDVVLVETGLNKLPWRFRKGEFPNVKFDDDFPDTHNTEIKGIVGI